MCALVVRIVNCETSGPQTDGGRRGAEGITSAPAGIQKGHPDDPIAARARFVVGLLPRSGWPRSRPGTEDTPGWPGPGAEASCTGRSALAKHDPASGSTAHPRLAVLCLDQLLSGLRGTVLFTRRGAFFSS